MPLTEPDDIKNDPYRLTLSAEELTKDDASIDEGLHVKLDKQLPIMRESHDTKRALVATESLRFASYPQSFEWPLKRAQLSGIPGAMTDFEIATALADTRAEISAKLVRLVEVVQRIDDEIALRLDGKIKREPIGTEYFIDSDSGLDGNSGTSIGAAWKTFDKFTDSARAAGDLATIRGGRTADYDDGTDLTFTSSGTQPLPIRMEYDYDDQFSDHVDLSATATATFTVGSTTVTYTASVAGVLSVGDVIYASGDDNREFAYEVAVVATTTVTLYLPYKGGQAGSGKTTFNMQSMPVWHQIADNFQLSFGADRGWLFQGLTFNGTDTSVVKFAQSFGMMFRDCVFGCNAGNDGGVQFFDDASIVYLDKVRMFNHRWGIRANFGAGTGWAFLRDCLIDGNSVTNSQGFGDLWGGRIYAVDCELKGHASRDVAIGAGAGAEPNNVFLRNTILGSTTEISGHLGAWDNIIGMEDYNGTPEASRRASGLSPTTPGYEIETETTKVRAGGSDLSMHVYPSIDLSSAQGWWFGKLQLFERVIDLPASEKTLTVFFASDDNTDWTTNPTSGELWIEIEFWGHATNDWRRIVKSTGTIDFKTDTDFDQSLAVTITPGQAGLAYLRVWYCKPQEAGNTNEFYVDPEVVIS